MDFLYIELISKISLLGFSVTFSMFSWIDFYTGNLCNKSEDSPHSDLLVAIATIFPKGISFTILTVSVTECFLNNNFSNMCNNF